MNNKNLYIHIPAHLLRNRLPFLLNRKLQPEVACQDVTLDQLDFELLADCAAQLREQGLTTTLHAPYSGFNPGAGKKRLSKASRSLADKSLLLAEKIRARRVVFHPGLPYGSAGKMVESWLDNSSAFWPEFIARAKRINCIICLENIYETTPDIFIRLLQTLDSPHMGHVFDIGHWNIFGATKLLTWLDRVAPYLKHLHLHDNHGDRDEHLAIGSAYVPFSILFNWLKTTACSPTITLENRNLPHTESSLQAIHQHYPDFTAN